MAAQGIFIFRGWKGWRLALQSIAHVLAACALALCAMQHIQQSAALLGSVRGAPLVASSPSYMSVLKYRRYIGDFGPLVLLAVPLTTQMFNRTPPSPTQRTTLQSALADTGLLMSARCVQWGSILAYGVYLSTYAFDFWFTSGLPLGKSLT